MHAHPKVEGKACGKAGSQHDFFVTGVRDKFLRRLKESASDALPKKLWVRVELVYLIFLDGGHADDGIFHTRHKPLVEREVSAQGLRRSAFGKVCGNHLRRVSVTLRPISEGGADHAAGLFDVGLRHRADGEFLACGLPFPVTHAQFVFQPPPRRRNRVRRVGERTGLSGNDQLSDADSAFAGQHSSCTALTPVGFRDATSAVT